LVILVLQASLTFAELLPVPLDRWYCPLVDTEYDLRWSGSRDCIIIIVPSNHCVALSPLSRASLDPAAETVLIGPPRAGMESFLFHSLIPIKLPQKLLTCCGWRQTRLATIQRASMERVSTQLKPFRPENPLEKASTIPSPCIIDPRIARLENERVFAHTWQCCRTRGSGSREGPILHCRLGDEPIVVVRGEMPYCAHFYNVCRITLAAVVTEVQGCAKQFRCPSTAGHTE